MEILLCPQICMIYQRQQLNKLVETCIIWECILWCIFVSGCLRRLSSEKAKCHKLRRKEHLFSRHPFSCRLTSFLYDCRRQLCFEMNLHTWKMRRIISKWNKNVGDNQFVTELAFLPFWFIWHLDIEYTRKLYAFQCRSDLWAYVRNKSLRLSFSRQETDSVALWPDVKVLSWHKRLATHRHCLSIMSIHPRLQQRCVFSLLNCALSRWKTNSSSPFKFLLCKQKKQFSLSEHK